MNSGSSILIYSMLGIAGNQSTRILTEGILRRLQRWRKDKGPIQKSPLPFKHATKICHRNVTLELLGWFPIFFQGAAVFAEFGENPV